ASLPVYATVAPSGQTSVSYASSTSDPRALQIPGTTNRVAAAWMAHSNSFSINVNLLDGQAHNLALYALDWDNLGRTEQIQVSNAATGVMLDSETISSFTNGVYLQWAISGDVVIKITQIAGTSHPIVNALFFDPVMTAATSLTVSSTSAAFGQAVNL